MNFEQIKKVAMAVKSHFPYTENQGLGFIIASENDEIVVFQNAWDSSMHTYGCRNSSLKEYFTFPRNGDVTKFTGTPPEGQRVFFNKKNTEFQIGYDSQKPEKHKI